MRKKIIGTVLLIFLFTVLPALAPEKASAAAKFADGEYSIPFTVLKDSGNEQSTTADYMVSPAKVIIQNDKTYVVVTLNNSSWWQYFKVQSGGGFADVQTVSNDTANDKRVVKFEVKDIEQLVNAKIHIIVSGIPGFSYDNKYDIRFKFTSSNIPLAPVAEKPTPVPTPKPAVTETPVSTPTEKPVEKITEKKQEPVSKSETKTTPEEKSTANVIVSETPDPKEEKATEPDKSTEQSEDENKVEPIEEIPEEIDTEEKKVEEPSEITEEAIEEVVETESASKSSSPAKLLIVIFTVLILGGFVFFLIKKRPGTR